MVKTVGVVLESSAATLPFLCFPCVVLVCLPAVFATARLRSNEAFWALLTVLCLAVVVGVGVFGVKTPTLGQIDKAFLIAEPMRKA